MTCTKYCGPVERIPYSNTGSAIAEGDLVVRASGTSGCVGVAVADIAATTGTGELDIAGTFSATKEAGEVFTDGQVLYWDGTALTGTSSSTFTYAGRSVGSQATAATTCKITINA